MAILPSPESSSGVMGAIKGALGLFGDTNKSIGATDNTTPIPKNEYESSLTNEEILELVSSWKKEYSVYFTEIEKGQKLSFDYWVGKHRNPDSTGNTSARSEKDVGITDNLIFESVETFLPIATRANPEPLVSADPGELGQKLSKNIQVALAHEADIQQLRRKLAKTTRNWLLDRIGVVKIAWNPLTQKIETDVIKGKKLIFDKDGYINEKCQFVGDYIGEPKKLSAAKLSIMFPEKKTDIMIKAHGKKGTKLDYIEWWYQNTDVFYTIDDNLVLGKFKNPNWNYDDIENGIEATNHLDEPSYPYRLLSIFNTGEQPHDNTSLILQNIPQQDKINRREVQIDKNVEGMNNGIVVSGTAFTEDQAAQAAAALRRGVAIRVPNGDVQTAVMFPQKPSLPPDVFNDRKDARAELRNVFGISGSTPQGIKSEETARGKILVNQMDGTRIGGGITEYIEQLADSIYNLWVQMMFVYYDEEHFVTAAGVIGGTELITLKNTDFALLKTLTITVKEGSLIPKDPLTQRNEAIDLWSANAIDPLSLYKKLDFPDPAQAANQLILWQMLQKGAITPEMYLPTFRAASAPTSLPTEQPKTGDEDFNTIPPNNTITIPQGGLTAESIQQQGKQLLQSVPIQ